MEKNDVIFLNAAWENVSTCPTTVFARNCMNWLMFLVAFQSLFFLSQKYSAPLYP